MPRRADVGEKFAQTKARPSVVEDGQTAIVQGVVQLHLIGREEVLTLEGSGDELAGGGRQIGDIANGAGTGSLGRAERFAHEVRDVALAVFSGGSGGLNEHGLQDSPHQHSLSMAI